MGWRVTGDIPKEVTKAVIVCAPHTSNWDFPLALASFQIRGLKLNYFMKKSWFFFPINYFFSATGGIPVDRSKSNGLIPAMITKMNESNRMIIAIPAEGTRSWVSSWKKGFYLIAKGANVPLIMGFVDFKRKEVGFSSPIYLTEDFEEDMKKIQIFFKGKTPRYPDKYNSQIF
jgi:1-acyl-sn-glycerol-3-phosphate acyltransferase